MGFGLTQLEMARIMGFGQQQRISEIESGNATISRGTEAMLKILGLVGKNTIRKLLK